MSSSPCDTESEASFSSKTRNPNFFNRGTFVTSNNSRLHQPEEFFCNVPKGNLSFVSPEKERVMGQFFSFCFEVHLWSILVPKEKHFPVDILDHIILRAPCIATWSPWWKCSSNLQVLQLRYLYFSMLVVLKRPLEYSLWRWTKVVHRFPKKFKYFDWPKNFLDLQCHFLYVSFCFGNLGSSHTWNPSSLPSRSSWMFLIIVWWALFDNV